MSRNRQTPTPATPSGSHVLEATENESAAQFPRILRLRAEDNNASSSRNNDEDASNRRIRWSEDVVDNEGMGKKKSKVCCIYHKPRPVGESSSESESDSSSSDSDSDSETDHQPRSGSRHSHPHNAGSTRDDDQTLERGRATCCAKHHSKEGKRRKPSPNAYEKMPTPGKSHTKSQGS